MFKIAVLISGGGSNLQSIIDTISTSKVGYEISCVIADRECYGIERAENNHIETKIFVYGITGLILNVRELFQIYLL